MARHRSAHAAGNCGRERGRSARPCSTCRGAGRTTIGHGAGRTPIGHGGRRTPIRHALGLLITATMVGACGSSATTEATSPTTLPAGGSGGSTTSSTTTSSGGNGGSGASGADGGGGSNGCPAVPACDLAPPDPGAAQQWRHSTTPITTTSLGSPRHRGRDLMLRPTDQQWVLAKFAYGAVDKDLVDEDVDIYLLRDCAGDWELIGTATTTDDGDHVSVEGVEDTGGRIYFRLPAEAPLGLGRHRVHLVVKGDLSTADLFIEVRESGQPIFVSDVDGTLTTYETEEFVVLLTGALPDANPNAATTLSALAAKGVRPFYMTARPEWLDGRTREFLAEQGFPPGIVHTTLSSTGALGGAAASYKTGELAVVNLRGYDPTHAFGNTDSDGQAYADSGIEPDDHRVFFQFDDPLGGRRIEDYAELLPEIEAMPGCP